MGRSRRFAVERDPHLAVAYLRVSTDAQAERGVSLDAQLAEIQRYAAAHGYTVADVYTERGRSGLDKNRPEFQRMLGHILASSSRIGCVIVVHSSRFTRSAEHAAIYGSRLARKGISVIATQQPFGDGPESVLMRRVASAVDEYGSLIGGIRTRIAMVETVRQGFFVGSLPPFGFRTVLAAGPGGAAKKKLAVAADEAAVVRVACSLYLTRGGLAVAAELNARGLLHRGRRWDRDRVLGVISDESLVGTYSWGRTDSRTGRERPRHEWASFPVDPIVDRDVFERVQALREHRDPDRNPGREASSPLMLAGLVVCGQCGARYQLQTAGKRRKDNGRYEYIQCSASRRRGVGATGSCAGRPVAVDNIDTEVVRLLLDAVFSPERCRILLGDLVEREGLLGNRVAAERGQWEREHANLENSRARLVRAIESADVAPAGLVERLTEVEARLGEARERLDKIAVLHDAPPWLCDDVTIEAFRVGMIAAMRARPEISRAYMHALGCVIIIGPDGITIASGRFRGPSSGGSEPARYSDDLP